jgi:hypothetical protein
MAKQPIVTYPTILALAATCAAYRINGGQYLKHDTPSTIWDHETHTQVPNPHHALANKNLVVNALANSKLITEADHQGALLLEHYFKGKLMSFLGEQLTDFENKMFTLATGDLVTPRDLGIIAYMPAYHAIKSAQETVVDRLQSCQRDYLAPPNERIETTIEVVRNVYSEKYSCCFITAITHDNKRVLFAYSGQTPITVQQKYSIKATVKRHDTDWVTVLGRVKPTPLDNNSPS